MVNVGKTLNGRTSDSPGYQYCKLPKAGNLDSVIGHVIRYNAHLLVKVAAM